MRDFKKKRLGDAATSDMEWLSNQTSDETLPSAILCSKDKMARSAYAWQVMT